MGYRGYRGQWVHQGALEVNQETKRGNTQISKIRDQQNRELQEVNQRLWRAPKFVEVKQRSAVIQRPGPCLWDSSGNSPEMAICRVGGGGGGGDIFRGVWLGVGSSGEVSVA